MVDAILRVSAMKSGAATLCAIDGIGFYGLWLFRLIIWSIIVIPMSFAEKRTCNPHFIATIFFARSVKCKSTAAHYAGGNNDNQKASK